MPLDYRRGTLFFDPTRGRTQTEVGAVVFRNPVTRADVSIAGYDITYNNGDHHLLQQMIDAKIEKIELGTVFFRVNFLLRDSSGNKDDPFSGTVNVLVIADVPTPQRQLSTGAVLSE